jgi:hypothetical protein
MLCSVGARLRIETAVGLFRKVRSGESQEFGLLDRSYENG